MQQRSARDDFGEQVVRMASCNWKPTMVEEIKTFIPIHVLMGIHMLPDCDTTGPVTTSLVFPLLLTYLLRPGSRN
jgi:hypothetical protein